MSFFRRILRPSNALILSYDHLDVPASDELESQVGEVRRHYQMVKLSNIVENLTAGRALGQAAVVFRNARKSFFLRALAFLRTEEIPVTLFLQSDCIGTNRLPTEEELRLFQRHYPGQLADNKVESLIASGWEQPEVLDNFVQACRKEIGPFPLNELDPTTYFSTWGKLLEIPPELRDFGIRLSCSPRQTALLRAQLTFIRQQTGTAVRMAYSPQGIDGTEALLEGVGLNAVVVSREGMIDRSTSPWNLPTWGFEKHNEGD